MDFVKRELKKKIIFFNIYVTKNPHSKDIHSKDKYIYYCRNRPQEYNAQFLAI